MKTLFVGTIDGIFTLERSNGGWKSAKRDLQGIEVCAIAVMPGNKSTVYAATRGHGLYRSEDGGGRWENRGGSSLPPKLRCLTIDPTNSAVLYAGTEPAALYSSSDEGNTWREIPGVRELAQKRQWTYPVPNIEPHVRAIAIDPRNASRIYLATQVGGVALTEDGGKNWHDVRDSIDMDVHSIVIDSQHSNTVYAATGGDEAFPNQSLSPKGRPLYRTQDGGRSWQSITDDLERTYAIPIKVDPQNSQLLYLGLGRDVPPYWLNRATMGDAALMRSTDGGRTWQRLANGLPDPLVSMVECIEIDREDPKTVVIATGGEGARFVKLTEGEVFLSNDRGDHWGKIGESFPIIYSLALQ